MSGIKDAKRRQQRRQQRRRRKKKIQRLTVLFGSLFLILLLVFTVRGITHKSNEKEKKEEKKTTVKKEKIDTSHVEVKNLVINTKDNKKGKNKTRTITISSMGDCTLGTDENFNQSRSLNAFYNSQGADYFFKNVRSILEKDDLSIVNFEGTLTTSTTRAEKKFAFKADPEYVNILTSFKNVRSILEKDDLSIVNFEGTLTTSTTRAEKKFAFKADPEYVNILTSGSVEAANIANNHSSDYGETSKTDTLKVLKDAGIAAFGYEQVQLLDVNGVKVGLTGIYELAEHLGKKQQVKENIAALKEAGAELIIVNFHWGIEREYVPNETQKKLAHLAIDEGADLVIGHHPHVLQGIEKYKGKYIAYRLGNFCFGGNSNPQDKDTIIFQQTFTIEDGKLKEDDNINIIPCSVSSKSNINDYCPTPLEGDEKQRVLDKIEEYSGQI